MKLISPGLCSLDPWIKSLGPFLKIWAFFTSNACFLQAPPPPCCSWGPLREALRGKVKVLLKLLSGRNGGTNASLVLSFRPSTLCSQDTQRRRRSWGSEERRVFSLELSWEGLAHFLPLEPGGGSGGDAGGGEHRSILHPAIPPSVSTLPFGINDRV